MGLLDRARALFAKPAAPVPDLARRAWLERTVDQAAAAAIGRRQQAQRLFDAAQTPEWTSSWGAGPTSLNADLETSVRTLRARSRGLAQNNEWAKRFLLQLRTNVLGPAGIALQMRLLLRNGKPAEAVNDAIECAWACFGKRGNCDVSGRYSFRQIEALALRHLVVDGAYLIRKIRNRGPHGFLLQMLNPNVLDHDIRREWQGNRVRLGVEVNDEGKPLAYWLKGFKAGEVDGLLGQQIGQHFRVPADQIIHGFVNDEADQFDGVPWLAFGARRLWLTQQFEEAASVQSVNAARTIGFFQSPDGTEPAGFVDEIISTALAAAKAEGRVLSPEEIDAIRAQATQIHTTNVGEWNTLPPGYQANKLESDFPHVNHSEFVKHGVRGFAAGLGVSYVTLGNDLEAVNYSSARVGVIDEREGYKITQADLIETLHQAVFEAWLEQALVWAPELRKLQFDKLAAYCDAATWQPRRWAGIDPNKDADANEKNLANRLTSRRRIILERGEDPDEIFSEIEAEEALFGEVEVTAPVGGVPAPDDGEADDGAADPAKTDPAARTRLRVAARNNWS